MRTGSLFSGYGGLELAVNEVFGSTTAWVSDIDKGACKILAHRFPDTPNLGDITTVDWSQVEPVDILTGGSPCQDLSSAGKRAGMTEGTRSNLWVSMREVIAQIRPGLVVWENVRGALSACADSEMGRCPRCVDPDSGAGHAAYLRALGRVLGDLSELGFDCRWHSIRAADVGAPHGRFRVFVTAQDADGDRESIWPTPSVPHGRGESSVRSHGPDLCAHTPTNPEGFEQREPDITWLPARSRQDTGGSVAWGDYGPAVNRWERLLGRPAPAPTGLGPNGRYRLEPRFVEWMQGLPAGWVTDVPGITRNEALKALGNGVVRQQAAAALRTMLAWEVAA